jgi:hypothetical protein
MVAEDKVRRRDVVMPMAEVVERADRLQHRNPEVTGLVQ